MDPAKMDEIIEKFIEDFESEFKSYLRPAKETQKDPSKKLDPLKLDNFVIYLPEKEYSDWDLNCGIHQGKATPELAKQMEKFVKGYASFDYAGLLLTFSDKFINIWHNPNGQNQIRTLPFMAFIPSGSKFPFFDLHVDGVENNIIKEVYRDKTDEELISWLILTAWRKIKNGEDAAWFIQHYICPGFPEENQNILQNPIFFFKNYFSDGSYADCVNFLNS